MLDILTFPTKPLTSTIIWKIVTSWILYSWPRFLLLFQISNLSYQEWIWWNQHHSTLPSWNVGLFCQMTKTAEWRFLSIYIPNSRSSFFKGAGTCRQFQQSWQRPTTSFAPPPCHRYPSAFADMYQPSTGSLTWQNIFKKNFILYNIPNWWCAWIYIQ